MSYCEASFAVAYSGVYAVHCKTLDPHFVINIKVYRTTDPYVNNVNGLKTKKRQE